jgi:hypothetical protein
VIERFLRHCVNHRRILLGEWMCFPSANLWSKSSMLFCNLHRMGISPSKTAWWNVYCGPVTGPARRLNEKRRIIKLLGCFTLPAVSFLVQKSAQLPRKNCRNHGITIISFRLCTITRLELR